MSDQDRDPAAFDNRAFWSRRYTTAPWLGSGPGSRGIAAWYKRAIVERVIVERDVRSVLDVGCGDLCWIDPKDNVLDARNIRYMGLDIAAPVVALGQARFPQFEFRVFDLLADDLPDGFDLLICFDVLIHQCGEGQLLLCMDKLVAATNGTALISYSTPGCTEPAMPDLASPDASALEAAFQDEFRTRRERVEAARVRTLGSFPDLVRQRHPTIGISELGRYRFQTIYELGKSTGDEDGAQHSAASPR
ncbi:hypothetical protein PQJ75_06685 [Rhodoplanes sp. TEM]|uniref:Methyltransferase domain-containing protein n=1 Tax=Rhodoplanes tepidamans TaxID=200616 RepID=A0ABT5J447_RHOTP|nr:MULTISPECIES: hypothetical protein [Rhodoplanes]MDC7784323.1 hypothetical protein [Rhodoplanes tepidamans]MDC7983413.1 hypothetical protein [Rhodoplanes sp. TEM]MDQ0354549.1 SAM-dependent methyltransferase [Rhodoplanes tepidamans]